MADDLMFFNKIWIAISCVLMVAILMQVTTVFQFQKEAERIGLEVNKYSDLYQMVIYSVVIGFYRLGTMSYIKPLVYKRIESVDPEAPDLKKDKGARALVGFLWYVFSTVSLAF